MRSRLAAMAVSILAHAIAVLWIAGRAMAVPSGTVRAAVHAAETPPEPLQVEILEAAPAPPPERTPPHRAPPPRPRSAATARRTTAPNAGPPQPAIATASATAPTAPAVAAPQPAISTAAGATAEPAPDAAPARRMRPRFPCPQLRMGDKLLDSSRGHETLRPPSPPEINDAAHACDAPIGELELKLVNPRWRVNASAQEVAGAEIDLESMQRERADLTMKPAGGGRYVNDEDSFTVDVARDGTVAIHDKPPIRMQGMGFVFDLDAILMRAHGDDPYARAKLHFLDRTRDERAELGRRRRSELLARSAELMLAHIDRLWARVRDPAIRREALFELWDDCAETGDAELLAGAEQARRMVIGEIRARLRGDDAYTPEELARLNARRISTARFAPYDDSPPAP